MNIPSGRVDFAFGIPYGTRPAEADWVTPAVVLRRATLQYGVRGRTGEPEPSKMVLEVDDPGRDLDPKNTAGAYYPDVTYRTRVRVVAEVADDTDRTVLTGFIASITWASRVATNLVTIELDDLLAVTAATAIGATAFDVELQRLYPPAGYVGTITYWPLAETAGRSAAEVYSGRGGAYLRQVTPANAAVPWDDRPMQEFGWTGTGEIQRAELQFTGAEITVATETKFTVSLELALSDPSFNWPEAGGGVTQAIWGIGSSSYDVAIGGGPSAIIRTLYTSAGGRSLRFQVTWDAGARSVYVDMPLDVFDDGQSHQVVARLSSYADRSSSGIWVDGEKRTGTVSTTNDAALDVDIFKERPHYISGGPWEFDASFGITDPDTALKFTAGRVVFYEYFVLGDDEITALWAARSRPWDRDRTGARLARAADLAGVDPLDLDLDVGVGICGPVAVDGRTLGELVDETAATEAGVVFCAPDGRIRSRNRTPNTPTVVAIYGDVIADGVVIHEPIEEQFDLARAVTVAEVEWVGADRPEVIKGDTTFGDIRARVTTAASTAGGARAVGQRLVSRNTSPRGQIDAVTVLGVLPSVTLAATLDIRPGDAILNVEDDVATTYIVETVEHDWTNGVALTTTFGVREHLTLPVAQFDVAGRGFDLSVFGTDSRGATVPGRLPGVSARRTSPAGHIRRRRRSLTP